MKRIVYLLMATVITLMSCGNKTAANNDIRDSVANSSLREKLEWLPLAAPANEQDEIEKLYISYRTPDGEETTLTSKLPWPIDSSDFNGGEINEVDINFDGYPDLVVSLGTLLTSIGGRLYDAFVWNEEKQAFDHVEEYKDIENATPQPDKKRIMSYIPARDGSINYYEYKWKDGKLEETRSWNAATDEECIVADGPESIATDDQWTEEAVEKQIKKVYAEVSKAFAPSKDGLENNIDLDAMFCTKYWNENLQEARAINARKKADDRQFDNEQIRWTYGMDVPVQPINIKVELLTGNMATATFDLKSGEFWMHTILGLEWEGNQWRINDWEEVGDNSQSLLGEMIHYVEKNRR
ncbi:MAG: hypothetical protein IJ635_06845 [Bacteroidaceae bacterium]|nr:hypothetical protein [Bacteroidaceae bacterium]